MIVTVTLNAAIDRTLRVPALTPGALHHAESDCSQAGGKGVNVARVLHALGVPVHALVVVGGESGAWIERDLARAGLPFSAIRAPGESRTCLELLEPGSSRVTQVHGPGVRGDDAVAGQVVARVAEVAAGAAWVAFCGSLPPGLASGVLAAALAVARSAGASVALDTSGEPLRVGWATRPDLVRVNLDEARGAGGLEGRAALEVISDGAGPVRARRADGERWRALPPTVRVGNPLGCGDAMMAGLLATLRDDTTLENALRRGIALAAAQAECDVAGRADPARASALERDVRLQRE